MASRGSRAKPAMRDQIFSTARQNWLSSLAVWRRRGGGQGSFIPISGEPGIGKTRLAQAAAVEAKKKGFSVFWGQCHEGQYVPPY